jgi:glycosyltransferase involved in cell wall biosynthesis
VRVGLDARTLTAPLRSGVEQYVVNLVRALAEIETAPEIIAYTNRAIPDPELARAASSGSLRTQPIRTPAGWLRAALPWRLYRDHVDVAHFPSTILPPLLPCPAVVTVHDLAWRRFPESYPADDLGMQMVALTSARRAARVIAVSNTTARDLEDAGVSGATIEVVPLGVAAEFTAQGPGPAPDAFPGAERLQQGYLLSVSRLQARKNLRRVVEAYRRVRETQEAPPLVLAGGNTEYGRGLARYAEELGVAEHVLFPGQVPEATLPALYRGATAFLYLSLYEGFGLPVLEAMACGTPVVTSNVGGTAEVASDAALVVNPERVEEIAEAVLLLLQGAEVRASFRERGLVRARHFTWERTARETIGVYQHVAARG